MTMGPLIILSGPSGSGKSTLIAPAAGGADLAAAAVGVGDDAAAAARRAGRRPLPLLDARALPARKSRAGGFLEWAEVFGNYYGTLKQRGRAVPRRRARACCSTSTSRAGGRCGSSARTRCRSSCGPRRWRCWKSGCGSAAPRRRSRSQRRLRGGARASWPRRREYEYQVINDDLDSGGGRACAAIVADRCSKGRRMLDDLKEEGDRQQGGRPLQAVHADSEADGRAQHRRPAAGRPAHQRQDGHRHSGDPAGQDLPGSIRRACRPAAAPATPPAAP